MVMRYFCLFKPSTKGLTSSRQYLLRLDIADSHQTKFIAMTVFIMVRLHFSKIGYIFWITKLRVVPPFRYVEVSGDG